MDEAGAPFRSQLLRYRWWPATCGLPKTVVTFDVLDTFERLSLQSKINMYDYYTTIAKLTDCITTGKLKVSSKVSYDRLI